MLTNFMQILFPDVTGHSVYKRELNKPKLCLFEIQVEWMNIPCVGS